MEWALTRQFGRAIPVPAIVCRLMTHERSKWCARGRAGLKKRLAADKSVSAPAGPVYELGPEPPSDDVDGRSPSVVTWGDGEIFCLVASGELRSAALVEIARSLYR
jgi:hypothetical protein